MLITHDIASLYQHYSLEGEKYMYIGSIYSLQREKGGNIVVGRELYQGPEGIIRQWRRGRGGDEEKDSRDISASEYFWTFGFSLFFKIYCLLKCGKVRCNRPFFENNHPPSLSPLRPFTKYHTFQSRSTANHPVKNIFNIFSYRGLIFFLLVHTSHTIDMIVIYSMHFHRLEAFLYLQLIVRPSVRAECNSCQLSPVWRGWWRGQEERSGRSWCCAPNKKH